MRLERVTSAAHPMYTQAMALYKKSFPPYEQREAPSQECILGEEDFNFALVYDGKLFVGLVLYWEAAEYLYIEHFCILQTLRNHHYGQRTLDLLAEFGKTLILEIDPPTDAIARRRKMFYERCSFAENPFPHIHPPYHTEKSRSCPCRYDLSHTDSAGKIQQLLPLSNRKSHEGRFLTE